MRFQQPIFMDNPSVIRNRDITNVNMSSDLCVYVEPFYTVSGGSKIISGVTTADTFVHITSNGAELINLVYEFTGGTTATTYNTKIIKYDASQSAFTDDVVYQTGELPVITTNFDISPYTLRIDGEYLIKTFYDDLVCTDILNRLGVRFNTEEYSHGELYGEYVPSLDYYFIAFFDVEQPILYNVPSTSSGNLTGIKITTLFPLNDGDNFLAFNNIYKDEVIVNLNGLTLANIYDYSISGNMITFSGMLKTSDVVTIIGVIDSSTPNNIAHDTFLITSGITSGDTASRPVSGPYFNTDNNKFELYTTLNQASMPIISINGVTLGEFIDYNRDPNISNRIILEGNLIVTDVITVVYQAYVVTIGEVNSPNPIIVWSLSRTPENNLGIFIFEVSLTDDFTSGTTATTLSYIPGITNYQATINTSGIVNGTTLYYRIFNRKVYRTLLGEDLIRETYSETIPIIIMI